MRELLRGRTTIFIAHRMSTAAQADRVGVVEAGRLVELGKHRELLDLGGRYATLFAESTSAMHGQAQGDRQLPAVAQPSTLSDRPTALSGHLNGNRGRVNDNWHHGVAAALLKEPRDPAHGACAHAAQLDLTVCWHMCCGACSA